MTENELAAIVVDACYRIHTGMGPGLLESVYEIVLAKKNSKDGVCGFSVRCRFLLFGRIWFSRKAFGQILLLRINLS